MLGLPDVTVSPVPSAALLGDDWKASIMFAVPSHDFFPVAWLPSHIVSAWSAPACLCCPLRVLIRPCGL